MIDQSEPPEDGEQATEETQPLPTAVIDDAERLRRLERNAIDPDERAVYATRRERLLEHHEYTDHIRDDDGDEVLVLHPDEWHDSEEGVIRTDRIEDLSRAVEVPLDGPGAPEEWETIDEQNRSLAEQVREDHGPVHGATAEALADFMSNHYAKPITNASSDELEEFRTDYFVRNAWPSAEQTQSLDESVELVFETAGVSMPGR